MENSNEERGNEKTQWHHPVRTERKRNSEDEEKDDDSVK